MTPEQSAPPERAAAPERPAAPERSAAWKLPASVRRPVSPAMARLVRYGISGGASALTHIGVGWLLAEGAHIRPVVASTAGFVASILVSYGLQHAWVFRSSAGHATAGSKFLAVTAVTFLLNTIVLSLGTEVLNAPYVPVQMVALVAIPLVNYTLNSRWTFRTG